MIWVKSAFSGFLVMVVGSFLSLAGFLYHLGRQADNGSSNISVGVSLPDLLHDPVAILILCAWFLLGSGLTYWYLHPH